MHSIVAVHIKMLCGLSHLINCVLNRYNRHDKKRWALGFEGFCRKRERCRVWLLDQFKCTLTAEERGNTVFHEEDRLSWFYQENKS